MVAHGCAPTARMSIPVAPVEHVQLFRVKILPPKKSGTESQFLSRAEHASQQTVPTSFVVHVPLCLHVLFRICVFCIAIGGGGGQGKRHLGYDCRTQPLTRQGGVGGGLLKDGREVQVRADTGHRMGELSRVSEPGRNKAETENEQAQDTAPASSPVPPSLGNKGWWPQKTKGDGSKGENI